MLISTETIQKPETTGAVIRHLLTFARAIPADLDTPVSAYLKLAGGEPSFLLESVTGGEQVARYSFIGLEPRQAYVLRGRRLERHGPDGVQVENLPDGQDGLAFLRAELARFQPASAPGLPRFSGGLAGYLGYELAHQFEPHIPDGPTDDPRSPEDLPDAILLLTDTLVAFDHAFGRMLLISNQEVHDPADPSQVQSAETAASARLDDLQARLAQVFLPERQPASTRPTDAQQNGGPDGRLVSNISHARFLETVEAAKEHIAAGDIFQVVLSQRFTRQTSAAPFAIYRALRRLNPSPYMFYFDFASLAGPDGMHLIGASPEMHVRLEGRTAAMRPIAGTRPRGATLAEDQTLQAALLADPKERAEHFMLVDLARNDLGRVCQPGSILLPAMLQVERYSHVMHIVSQVEGQLKDGLDAFDLMRATFPAGTVSGAPKIRAMQIIADLEPARRGPYAGAVGYFGFDGGLDTCITIRTLIQRGNQVSVQSGAGIVADSQPEAEYVETLNKARALATAIELAETSA